MDAAAFRESHLELSERDWELRRRALEDETLQDRGAFGPIREAMEPFDHSFQPWPTFLDERRMEELADVTRRLGRLVREVPRRILDNDPERIHRFYGFAHPALLQILLAEPNGLGSTMGRADFVRTEDGLKLLEFNFVSALGGWEVTELWHRYLRVPALAPFLDDLDPDTAFVRPMESLLLHLADTVRATLGTLDEPIRVALVDPTESPFLATEAGRRFVTEALERARRKDEALGQALLCRPGEPQVRRGQVWLDGERLHALVDVTPIQTPPDVYRCFKAGRVCLCNGPLQQILGDKRNLALLSEHAESDVLEEPEQELLRRHLPWTRCVAPRDVRYRDRQVPLPDLLQSHREEMVLKKALGKGGDAVHLGRLMEPAAWERAVATALEEGDWVVQERVESRPYLFQHGDRGCAPYWMVWGPFLFGERYGGAVLRMRPWDQPGLVNTARGAMVGTIVKV